MNTPPLRRLWLKQALLSSLAIVCTLTVAAAAPGQVLRLHSDTYSEAELRGIIAGANPGDVIYIESGSSWVLSATLTIPDGITLIGNSFGSDTANFIKGFNGTLATLGSHVNLNGLVFDGKKGSYGGRGITCGDGNTAVEKIMWTRVTVKNCLSHGLVLNSSTSKSVFRSCEFINNGGFGIRFIDANANHSLNRWLSCSVNNNGSGGVGLGGKQRANVWELCEFDGNGGAAFDQLSSAGVIGGTALRNCVVSDNNGPAWLTRGGEARGIAFVNCTLSNNGTGTGLSAPVGLFHVENGTMSLEIRGGPSWSGNSDYLFVTTPKADGTSKLAITGGGPVSMLSGNISIAPGTGYVVLTDTSMLSTGSTVTTDYGIGLDPITRKVVDY